MSVVAVVLLALNLAALALLLVRVHRLSRIEEAIAEEQAVAIDLEPLPPELERSFVAGKNRLISIEILNPLEIAAAQKKIARVVGSVAPGLVRKVVYEKALTQLREQLARQGIQAEVTLHVNG